MSVHDDIVRAAQENGIDPATALAISQRESSFNPDAGSGSKYSSAYGLFQLLKSERSTYGGSSSDPYEQASAWAHYIQGTRTEMESRLGRPVTGPELYLGHYFGGARAARMVSGSISPETPVSQVFSPTELAANPNIVRAGTTGALSSSIMNDISRRTAKFGGVGQDNDMASEGTEQPVAGATPAPAARTAGRNMPQTIDLSKFGTLMDPDAPPGQGTPQAPAASSIDLSSFGRLMDPDQPDQSAAAPQAAMPPPMQPDISQAGAPA